jgi:hypothetical protein
MVDSQASVAEASAEGPDAKVKFRWLSPNPGRRRTEIIYFVWFLATTPMQAVVTQHLSYDHPNDVLLLAQSLVMALGILVLPVVFRAREDRGRPLRELFGFRMGLFIFIWGVIGGFIGTDPWYEVLHGHFGYNTVINPNGVPLFLLFMTVGVFGFYVAILSTLYRIIVQLLDRTRTVLARDSWLRHGILCLLLGCLIPLLETSAYGSGNYCFDAKVGAGLLNVLIYGSWQFAALLFYTRWDAKPGQRTSAITVVVGAFATVGIMVSLMAAITTFIAPHFINVEHGLRQVNDWSANNCLGPKPS